jgi:hypothetical protein
VSAWLFFEGGQTGPQSGKSQARCREALSNLLKNMGFTGRLPRISVCGGRRAAFDKFQSKLNQANNDDYIAMLIDSEDPPDDIGETWRHLKKRPGDGWEKPEEASNEQVLFMTTCMETWIVADRKTVKEHYGVNFQENALPPEKDMHLERRGRDEMLDCLVQGTRNCKNAYKKGARSFEILGKLNPCVLKEKLPSFSRVARILDERLK